jgi:hypothetical protein
MIGLPLLALNAMNEQINSGKSFVINTNSDVYEYKGEFTLDSLYQALDCETIEVVNLKDNLILICDEEALYKAYPVVNMIATNMYREAYDTNEVGIIGKCIICQSSKLS